VSADRHASVNRAAEKKLAEMIEARMWEALIAQRPDLVNDLALAMTVTQTAEAVAREWATR
jgi:hypothetical protein